MGKGPGVRVRCTGAGDYEGYINVLSHIECEPTFFFIKD